MQSQLATAQHNISQLMHCCRRLCRPAQHTPAAQGGGYEGCVCAYTALLAATQWAVKHTSQTAAQHTAEPAHTQLVTPVQASTHSACLWV